MTVPQVRIAPQGLVAVGAGLVVEDVVTMGRSSDIYQRSAGGTCGNVLTILGYLGWDAYPVARLGVDEAGQTIVDDMGRFGVHQDFLSMQGGIDTPIIVERIRVRGQSGKSHSFSQRCPSCGSMLPQYRPLPKKLTSSLKDTLPDANVFFFDRVSPGTLDLARHYRERGTVIVFEPGSTTKARPLADAVALADIVKYSTERLAGLEGLLDDTTIPLIVETRGRDGLRYATRTGTNGRLDWRSLSSYLVTDPIDEAGCGDWCTAGVLHELVTNGVSRASDLEVADLLNAIRLGQAMAAANCNHIGARGGMYGRNIDDLNSEMVQLTRPTAALAGPSSGEDVSDSEAEAATCSACTAA